MGSSKRSGTWRFLRVLALAAVVIGVIATLALAGGPGGWDHLGVGTAGNDSLNDVASALATTPGALYVGGAFTEAGGIPEADRIAAWNGSSWSAVGTPTEGIPDGRVSAIAVSAGKVYAGGSFHDAGGNGSADFLAVWDGVTWEPFCAPTGPGYAGGNVTSLQIVGPTLYVGGEFQNGAGIASADYLLACDLATGASSSTVVDEAHAFPGSVYALAAGSDGTLYAGGNFTNLGNVAAADYVVYLSGGAWHPMGGVTGVVRGLTTVGTDAYAGSDGNDVAGIPEADHVAKWNGSTWSALGANTAGTNGWFPTTASIEDLAGTGSNLFATGTFQDANGDARADHVAFFDGAVWHPLGSNGLGDGPFGGVGLALALVDRQLYAAGNFTSAGGDPQARSVASFALAQVIAYPTPTVTAGPSAVPTPTVTPSPPAPDVKPPATSLRRAQINQALRKATFKFASSEPGSKFACKLDVKSFKPCASPKTYRKLAPGKHVFRVKARDRAGNVDRTPTVKRFRIKNR